MERHRPDVILYWESASGIAPLEALVDLGSQLPMIFVSYGILKEKYSRCPKSPSLHAYNVSLRCDLETDLSPS